MRAKRKVQSDTKNKEAAKRRARRRKLALVVGLAEARRRRAGTSDKDAAKRRAKRRKAALLVGLAAAARRRRRAA
jgi:hypothetical protein